MLCVETGLGQAAKLLGARADMRVSCAFRTGKFGKNVVHVKVRIGLEVTVREQQRRVRYETQKARWRHDTQTTNLLDMTWAMRVCAHAWKCANVTVRALCAEKCACNKVSVRTCSVGGRTRVWHVNPRVRQDPGFQRVACLRWIADDPWAHNLWGMGVPPMSHAQVDVDRRRFEAHREEDPRKVR